MREDDDFKKMLEGNGMPKEKRASDLAEKAPINREGQSRGERAAKLLDVTDHRPERERIQARAAELAPAQKLGEPETRSNESHNERYHEDMQTRRGTELPGGSDGATQSAHDRDKFLSEHLEHHAWTEKDTSRLESRVQAANESLRAGNESLERYQHELGGIRQEAERVSFSPETKGNHVFWAKENKVTANAFVERCPEYKAIGHTEVGKAFEKADLYQRLDPKHADDVWGILSERFAQDARGTAVVFDEGEPRDRGEGSMSLLYSKELPSLSDNHRIERKAFNPAPEEWKRIEQDVRWRPERE